VFDVIGDVHGQAPALRRLLARLGYVTDGEAMRHPERTAVFVGDYVDRGPDSPGVVRLVRAMVEAGAARAIMGNHEWNLLSWHVRHPGSRLPLRSHSEAHRRQLLPTLEQYARIGGVEAPPEGGGAGAAPPATPGVFPWEGRPQAPPPPLRPFVHFYELRYER